jgi:hypothetical protein
LPGAVTGASTAIALAMAASLLFLLLYAWTGRLTSEVSMGKLYMVCDRDGAALIDLVEEVIARGTAQALANRKGESVWLCASGSREEREEFKPEEEEKPGHPIERDVRPVLLTWREMGIVIAALQSQTSHLDDADDGSGGAEECRRLAERLMRIRKVWRRDVC